MKSRTYTFLVGGLIVGLVLGAVLGATNDGLKQLLGASLGADDANYYLVDIDTAATWLVEQQGDTDEISAATDSVVSLMDSSNLREALIAAESDIGTVLATTWSAVSGADSSDPVPSLDDASTSACLGLDDNPFSADGPGLFVYMKLPVELTDNVPDDWQQIEQPKSNDLYWQLLACYPEVGSA